MPTRRAILLAAVSCIAACITTSHLANAGPGAADDASALAFLSAIYNSYTSGSKDGPNRQRSHTTPLYRAGSRRRDEQGSGNRGKTPRRGELDVDPFIDAQDYDIKHFDVAIKDTAPGKATATVTFVNFDEQKTIVLELIAIKNDWRIYDITWPRDAEPKTLRALFRLTRQGY